MKVFKKIVALSLASCLIVGNTVTFANNVKIESNNIPISGRKYYESDLSKDLQDFVIKKADQNGIAPAIIISIIEHESGCNPKRIGDNGQSFGLMQIKKCYQKDRMKKLGCTDLLNPYDNITVGVDILCEYIEKYEDLGYVLMCYNGGERYAKRLSDKGIYISEYAEEVIKRSDELQDLYYN